jgi:regulator of sirC expression with transglutaminase-like and TPR domain
MIPNVSRIRRLPELAATDRLAECCLLLGTLVDADLDPQAHLQQLDQWAARVGSPTHLGLRRVIAIEEGIGGNFDQSRRLDSAFLHRVMVSRRGLPIIVSVIWIEVGRRAGIEMEGVGLPGHFLAYAGGQLVDPFHFGEAIGSEEAARLVAESIGGPPRLDRSWLSPVSSTDIVKRILRNLEGIYREGGDDSGLGWVGACLQVLGEGKAGGQ